MGIQPRIAAIQGSLETVTRRWWIYLVLLLLFFIPVYASKGYDPRHTMEVIEHVLSDPLIFRFPVLMPLAKLVPLALIAGVLAYGNRVRGAFNVYVAVLYLALAILQTTAITEPYGFVVMSGNLALVLAVALTWVWECLAQRSDFQARRRPAWRWWAAPVALVALLAPVDPTTMSPDFSPLQLMTNEAGLTFCMMTPVVLALLTLFHPNVNLAVLRVTGFSGIVLGFVNMVIWFGLQSWGWWMGVLHIPLVLVSVYAFALGIGGPRRESSNSGALPSRNESAQRL
jgi:hypothetical protein